MAQKDGSLLRITELSLAQRGPYDLCCCPHGSTGAVQLLGAIPPHLSFQKKGNCCYVLSWWAAEQMEQAAQSCTVWPGNAGPPRKHLEIHREEKVSGSLCRNPGFVLPLSSLSRFRH